MIERTNRINRADISDKMDKENIDPDYVLFDRNKSHNTAFYKNIPGVFTSEKEELSNLLKKSKRNSDASETKFSTISQETSSKGDSFDYWNHSLSSLLKESERDVVMEEEISEINNIGASFELRADVPENPEIEDLSYQNKKPNESMDVNKRKKSKKGTNVGYKKKKGNQSKKSVREKERDITQNLNLLNEKDKIRNLKEVLGNPWDSLTLEDKKKFALHFYYSHREVIYILFSKLIQKVQPF